MLILDDDTVSLYLLVVYDTERCQFLLVVHDAESCQYLLVVYNSVHSQLLKRGDGFLVVVVLAPAKHDQVLLFGEVHLGGVPQEVLCVQVDALWGMFGITLHFRFI